MNETEAFEAWCEREYGFTAGLMQDEARAGWQAALKWHKEMQRNQLEPVGYISQDVLNVLISGKVGNCMSVELDTREAWPLGEDESPPYHWLVALYTLPTTAQINEQMREALQDLIDVQNGPPLMKWKQEWEDAMAKAGAALIAAKSGAL